MIEQQPSCEDPSDPGLLPVEEALARIRQMLPVQKAEDALNANLKDATGHILAEDIVSPIDVPDFTNSAMDGYAIASADIPSAADGTSTLQVVGTSWAGRVYEGAVKRGQAVRIMTGGMMPAGLDTVVIQEHVQVSENGDDVVIDHQVEKGRNVRHAGEDVTTGQCVLQRGEFLGPAQIGHLASLGIASVKVSKPLTVAFFTTGDELRALDDQPGVALSPGQLYDSNRYTLHAMLERLGVTVIDVGIVRDNPEATRKAFEHAAANADVIVTSGGVSAGEADYVTRVIHEIGNVGFWKIAMRPGRPLAFGTIGTSDSTRESVFFGLPGNPVAVMVTFYEFVQPAILHMMGATRTQAPLLSARCLSKLKKSPGRTEYQRGILSLDENGQNVVETTGKQGAGRLSSMCSANCLIVLPPGKDQITPGDDVTVRPFFGLV